jgi:hypothetical protein
MHLGLRPGRMVKKGTQSRIHNTHHFLQLHLLHSASEHKPFLLVANAGSPWKTLDPCETHHLLTTLNPHRDTTSCFWMQQWPLDSKPSLRRAQDLFRTTLRFSGLFFAVLRHFQNEQSDSTNNTPIPISTSYQTGETLSSKPSQVVDQTYCIYISLHLPVPRPR